MSPVSPLPSISVKDRTILRDLARRLEEIAALPVMTERRELWRRHNSLQPTRPLLLVFPEGGWRELLTDADLLCESDQGRRIEWSLRSRIYGHEHFRDDMVIEDTWEVQKSLRWTGWGVEMRHTPSQQADGSWGFDPVIKAAEDLKRFTMPTLQYDPEATNHYLEEARDLFDGILKVRLRGVTHISFHLMSFYCQLRGLSQVMEDMTERPGMLHEAMAILEEGNRGMVRQYIEQNLLDLNNDNTYHSSGGNGWTDELPAPGFDPARVRSCDMWASSESQEMAQVGPEMHEEFCLQYEERLLASFGLNGYGCCEDLTRKLDRVFRRIPNLRRISISPWSNVEMCARQIQDQYIFSWKPNPACLVGEFNEPALRDSLQRALDATRGCVLEIILKDTHTCENHPERFDRWSEIACELVESHQ